MFCFLLVVGVVEHQQNRSFVLLLSLRTEGFSSYNDMMDEDLAGLQQRSFSSLPRFEIV